MKEKEKKIDEYISFLSLLLKDMLTYIVSAQKTIVTLGKAINKLIPYAEKSAPPPELAEITGSVRETLDKFVDEQEKFAKSMEDSEDIIHEAMDRIYEVLTGEDEEEEKEPVH